MKQLSSPVIGITSGRRNNPPKLLEFYTRAVCKAGGTALFIYPERNHSTFHERCDGIIIPGGKDLDPGIFGEVPEFEMTLEDPLRSDFEFSMLSEIMKGTKPVLGICYGMQLLNVFFGGSLYQDILSQRAGSIEHREGTHYLHVEANPYITKGTYRVNSSHHQAIKKTGSGINAFAASDDGLIEAVYHERHSFLLGLQWHPERMDDPLTHQVFLRFIGMCRADK